jgi:H+/Cl- antiporter ClcA
MDITDWLSGAALAGALLVDEILRFAFAPSGRMLAALLLGASTATAVAMLANRTPEVESARSARSRW